jgi:hypothetical protein
MSMAHITNREKENTKQRMITKRSMKNFTPRTWNESLANRHWESLGGTDDPNKMAKLFTEIVNKALDECAPMKTFTIKPGYRPGLTEKAKKLMRERERDQARKDLKRSPGENKILHEKYKKLRNKTTQQIRRDTVKVKW